MTATNETFQAAWIAHLKSKTQITSLLPGGTGEEIREAEYQSDKWVYPCIRVGLDFIPSVEGCGPDDATVYIEIFSEEKSSKEAAHIAAVIYQLYHKVPFEQSGVKFSTVVVRKIDRPERSIYAWMAKVIIFCQGV